MRPREELAISIRAYGAGCFGCQTYLRDVMMSYEIVGDPGKVHDLFLTQAQAELLQRELAVALGYNAARAVERRAARSAEESETPQDVSRHLGGASRAFTKEELENPGCDRMNVKFVGFAGTKDSE